MFSDELQDCSVRQSRAPISPFSGCANRFHVLCRLAGWYYTDGETLVDVVWTETLQELSFAGVGQIIESMRSPEGK